MCGLRDRNITRPHTDQSHCSTMRPRVSSSTGRQCLWCGCLPWAQAAAGRWLPGAYASRNLIQEIPCSLEEKWEGGWGGTVAPQFRK